MWPGSRSLSTPPRPCWNGSTIARPMPKQPARSTDPLTGCAPPETLERRLRPEMERVPYGPTVLRRARVDKPAGAGGPVRSPSRRSFLAELDRSDHESEAPTSFRATGTRVRAAASESARRAGAVKRFSGASRSRSWSTGRPRSALPGSRSFRIRALRAPRICSRPEAALAVSAWDRAPRIQPTELPTYRHRLLSQSVGSSAIWFSPLISKYRCGPWSLFSPPTVPIVSPFCTVASLGTLADASCM